MGVLRIQSFSGIIPVSGDRALPDGFATESVNTFLYGHELKGLRPPLEVIDVNPTTKKVLRIPKRTVGGDPDFPGVIPPPSYLGDSVWVQFTDPDTDIVRGQLIEDQYERYYFCSPTDGPTFNTYARMQLGLPAYKLGVAGPDISIDGTGFNAWAPTISSITGGAAPVVTRAYVYTWVNEYGEESSPSLPVLGAGNANGVWNIANILDPTDTTPTGYPDYTKKYLYRTITGASGQTTYYRVNEVALGTTTFADDGAIMTDAVLSNSLLLESLNWQPPPDELEGFIAMPNGFLIGFAGSDIYMSDPYHFHAWPPQYKQATETPVVGLGLIGQTCVVCTQSYPTAITGVKPATCSFTKITTGEPCLSRGSIVSTPDGVVYASQNGLILVGPSGLSNVTRQLITKEDWVRGYSPQFLRACRYQNGYLALRDIPDAAVNNSAFFIDPTELRVALTELSDFDAAVNVQVDFWSGEVFLIEAEAIHRWDPPSEDLMPVLWKSKEFQYQFEENFGCYAVFWDQERASYVEYGEDILPIDETVRFIVRANRQIVYDQEVPRNGKPVRLPSGFKHAIWQFELRSRAPIYALHIASTMKELKAV